MFPKIGFSPIVGGFILENPFKMDDLGGYPTIFGNIHILQLEMDVFSCFFLFNGSTSRKITQAMASDFSALLLENPDKKTNNCYIKEVPVTLQDQRFDVNKLSLRLVESGDTSRGLSTKETILTG